MSGFFGGNGTSPFPLITFPTASWAAKATEPGGVLNNNNQAPPGTNATFGSVAADASGAVRTSGVPFGASTSP